MTRRLLFACLLIAGCGHKSAPVESLASVPCTVTNHPAADYQKAITTKDAEIARLNRENARIQQLDKEDRELLASAWIQLEQRAQDHPGGAGSAYDRNWFPATEPAKDAEIARLSFKLANELAREASIIAIYDTEIERLQGKQRKQSDAPTGLGECVVEVQGSALVYVPAQPYREVMQPEDAAPVKYPACVPEQP